MVDCSHLFYKKSHCRGCSGHFCTSKGRKKKISDVIVQEKCKDEDEWNKCPRYLDALNLFERTALIKASAPTPKKQLKRCPYRGPRPDGECCGEWCYAVNAYLKLPHKMCGTGIGCERYWSGFKNKVPFYKR